MSSKHKKKPPTLKKPVKRKAPEPSWFRKCITWFIVSSIWVGIIGMMALIYYIHDLPDVQKLSEEVRTRKVILLADNKEVLKNYGDLAVENVTFKQIPPYLISAVVATEDRRFFEHSGVDIVGLIRAFYSNLRADRVVQGGSTISQQLAKIVFLNPNRTIKRKVQELLLALYLEDKLSKEQIMTLYLNRVYMGAGIYGVGGAAKYYFGKDVSELSILESAMIAGLLKAPSRYSPIHDSEIAGKRTYQILVNMREAGFITQMQLEDIQQQPLVLDTSAMGTLKNLYFTDWVMEGLPHILEDTESDLIVETTLNLALQEKAEEQVTAYMKQYGKPAAASQAAMVVMTPLGKVKAMIGGVDYRKSPYNRAVKAQRQPGSAFKIYVYVAAFDAGFTPWQQMEDKPISVDGWSPRNYSRKHFGMMSLKEAFARSINTIAVQLAEKVGRENVSGVARAMGVESPMSSHPSLALGTSEMNLLELTSGYAMIANGGVAISPYGIESIMTLKKKTLYQKPPLDSSLRMPRKTVQFMQELLREVVLNGSGKLSRIDGLTSYAKTGTSQDYRDAWFVGYTSELVTGIWVGNDDNTPMKHVTGAGLPARMWKGFMKSTLEYKAGEKPVLEAPVETPKKPKATIADQLKSFFKN